MDKKLVIIECKKLCFNWQVEKAGNISASTFETYEVGKDGVAKIDEIGDGSFKVCFEDGSFEQTYNHNRAKWEPVKP